MQTFQVRRKEVIIMKVFKKIISAAVCIILAAVIAFGAVTFWYYPHYRKSKTEVDIKTESAESFNVMSCNLRCWTPEDVGKKSWFYRADLIVKGIENNAPDIIGFQEGTKMQYSYMVDCLKGYDSVITYRDNSKFSEGCPVFYRTDRYTLVDKNSFWLSETPEKMSRDWGAACYRICSYVILKDNATGKRFVVFNTHLDHISDEARINGIGVVIDKIKQFGSIPAVLMGDFNAEEDSETYKSATDSFLDVKYQTKNTVTGCTYQGYGTKLDHPCIDYIVISKSGFKVKGYKVIKDTYDGVYSSDHFPIMATLSF